MMPVGQTGVSLDAHLLQAAKTATAHLKISEEEFLKQHALKVEGELPSEIPEELEFIYSVFVVLSAHRTSGASGFNPIALSEIDAWQRIHGVELELWELQILQRLDGLWMKVVNGRPSTTRDQNQESRSPGGGPKPGRPVRVRKER